MADPGANIWLVAGVPMGNKGSPLPLSTSWRPRPLLTTASRRLNNGDGSELQSRPLYREAVHYSRLPLWMVGARLLSLHHPSAMSSCMHSLGRQQKGRQQQCRIWKFDAASVDEDRRLKQRRTKLTEGQHEEDRLS